MSTGMSRLRDLLTAVAAIGTFLGVLFVPAGLLQAQAGTLFISEYVEGSATNQAIEIYNPTDMAVSLGASGYMLAFYPDGSTGIGGGARLVGTIQPGGTWVVTPTDASQALLARANQAVGPSAYWFDGNDAVALVQNGSTVDVIGQIGYDPGTAWGTGDVTTANHSLRRKLAVTEGDDNGTNAFDPATQWDAYPVDTFDGLGSYGAPTVNEPVAAICPAPFATTQGLAAGEAITATDPDGTVTGLAVSDVAASDPGTIAVTAFTPAPGAGGTASGTLSVGASTPVGAYTVTVTATNDDAEPQTATCTVDVTVNPVTPQTLRGLVDGLVTDGGVSADRAGLLRDRLDRLAAAMDAGRMADAAAQLRAFVNQVNGLSPRWITAPAAESLLAEAELLATSR